MSRPFLPYRRRPLIRSATLVVVLAACAVVESGCTTAVGAGKTPLDRLYSWAAGKDCSLVRARHGDAYCIEDEVSAPAAVHCYPTLGEVTCYAAPDPFPGRQRAIGSVPPSLQALPAAEGKPVHPPQAG